MPFFSGGIYGARTSAVFNKNNNTLADVTGISVNVEAGRVYRLRIIAQGTCAAADGIQFRINGTATMTQFRINQRIFNSVANTIVQAVDLAFNTAQGNATAGMTAWQSEHDGLFVVNAAGTLKLQFANLNGGGGASSINDSACYMELIQLT